MRLGREVAFFLSPRGVGVEGKGRVEVGLGWGWWVRVRSCSQEPVKEGFGLPIIRLVDPRMQQSIECTSDAQSIHET